MELIISSETTNSSKQQVGGRSEYSLLAVQRYGFLKILENNRNCQIVSALNNESCPAICERYM